MVKLNRPHIGIFGRMNVGKSSLINALTRQKTAVVADVAGTTTDPVKKNMEILGIGPVTLIDTAGVDDASELGAQRVAKTQEVLEQVNLAILVFTEEFADYEYQWTSLFRAKNIPYFLVHNKADLLPSVASEIEGAEVVEFSDKWADTGSLVGAIIRHMPPNAYNHDDIFDGFVKEGDEVVFVMPIDSSAPEGRLILPQVQSLRGLLDNHAVGICLQPNQLQGWLKKHSPKLVVTDSQVFAQVNPLVPSHIPLTSFSILFSRLKGDFDLFLTGTEKIDSLQEGDKVLVLESCTHSVNVCDDIGRVKLPALLQKKTGKKLYFDYVTNLDPLPSDLSVYKLALQCGGCMVTRQQILNRLAHLSQSGVPVSNYGLTIAWCTGIFSRVTEIFRR
ncbi:MAG: [Elusimicrobiaceae bacterium]|nr:[FeFe] hydrogenase H-cluster maturation GTPase HydF [Elusimicrobiaceae bacterium]